jgi:osmoprotectant transport system ATP-binding protein
VKASPRRERCESEFQKAQYTGLGPRLQAPTRAPPKRAENHGKTDELISCKDVSKWFGSQNGERAVDRVTLDVQRRETLVLLGASGSGKTTLLKLINRLIEPSEGRIEVGGTDTSEIPTLRLRRSIGYVFQDIGLFPHMTVRQNVEIVPRLLGWEPRRRRARADELLERVGLDPAEYARRRPTQLSGGQAQRVGIARALAADPEYLLMDEPFGALDAVTRDQLQDELLEIQKTMAKTIVFVTHDLFEALRLGDRIAVMHEGRLEQVGEADELLNTPATPFVESLFGHARRQARLVSDQGGRP